MRPRLALHPYQPGDIDRFIPRDDFALERAAVGWNWEDGPPGRTWTLTSYSRRCPLEVLGVGGLFDDGRGLWHAWALLARLTPREFYVAGRLAEDVICGVEMFNAPARISATARASMPGAVLLLEKLGFAPRGHCVDARIGPGVVYELMIREAA